MTKHNKAMLDSQIASLKEMSAGSTNTCTTAIYIAFCDKKVQSIFLDKIKKKNVFLGIHCEPSKMIEHVIVVISFRCPDDMICLIPPTFAVDVNIVGGEVTTIYDPYFSFDPRFPAAELPGAGAQSHAQ